MPQFIVSAVANDLTVLRDDSLPEVFLGERWRGQLGFDGTPRDLKVRYESLEFVPVFSSMK